MTGSDMGALMFTFLRPAFFVLATICALVAITFFPWAWLFATIFLALGLWAHFIIKRYEANYRKHTQEAQDWFKTSQPALFEALEKLKLLTASLPGNATLGYGVAFGTSTSSDYGLNINVSPKWQGDIPESVGDLSWESWCSKIPAAIDDFRLVVTLYNAPLNDLHFWTAADGFSEHSWAKKAEE